jgi:hypothetical protein
MGVNIHKKKPTYPRNQKHSTTAQSLCSNPDEGLPRSCDHESMCECKNKFVDCTAQGHAARDLTTPDVIAQQGVWQEGWPHVDIHSHWFPIAHIYGTMPQTHCQTCPVGLKAHCSTDECLPCRHGEWISGSGRVGGKGRVKHAKTEK